MTDHPPPAPAPAPASPPADDILRVTRPGIDTLHEHVIYMRADCAVCRAEGFAARARVRVSLNGRTTIATLHHVDGKMLARDQVGLSESAWRALDASEGAIVTVAHPAPLESLAHVRSKLYGGTLTQDQTTAIVADIVSGRYSDIEVAAFIAAGSGYRLEFEEILALTRAMVAVGDRLDWGGGRIVDKHCVGGLPGNRTTPIIVAIVAANGLTMPKTSSRAITSPAGTADVMETMAPVDLTLDRMRAVVERTGGCIAWGGQVGLSPADDLLIVVERALDIDSEGQLVASVLSKKLAAGSTHVVIDMPVGPTAKVRSEGDAARLGATLGAVARALGLELRLVETDGHQPVGRGIGPALEAFDVLAVLEGDPDAPRDLRDRALDLAGAVLELGGAAQPGEGGALATATLDDGRAIRKFEEICEAQGGRRWPSRAGHRHPVPAALGGHVGGVDNRRLAKVAKLAGAPLARSAGVELHVRLGDQVQRGQPLYTIHAESAGELAYALRYADRHGDIFMVSEL